MKNLNKVLKCQKTHVKILSFIYIPSIVLSLFSCKGDKIYNEESNTDVGFKVSLDPIDPIEKEKNIADILETTQDSLNFLFERMNLNIGKYLENNSIKIPSNSLYKYNLYERVLHALYYFDKEDCNSNVDLHNYLYISEIENKFLIDYILKQWKSVLNVEIYNKLIEEKSLMEEFILSQQNFLKTHIDEAYDDGSGSFIKYYSVADNINRDYLESLKDLYFTVTNSKIVELSYIPLDNDLFIKAYNHITNDLIPQQIGLDNIYYNRRYNDKRDKRAISNVKGTWEKLLSKRNEISGDLPQNLKDVWNNSTYRFQKSHLILLKNEFEGLGLTNNDMNNVLLPNSCSYKDLLDYPNFSTKWNEYVESI